MRRRSFARLLAAAAALRSSHAQSDHPALQVVSRYSPAERDPGMPGAVSPGAWSRVHKSESSRLDRMMLLTVSVRLGQVESECATSCRRPCPASRKAAVVVALSSFSFAGLAQDLCCARPPMGGCFPILRKTTSGWRASAACARRAAPMVRLVLNDDAADNGERSMHAGLGHFVCVDGFGTVSAEERDGRPAGPRRSASRSVGRRSPPGKPQQAAPPRRPCRFSATLPHGAGEVPPDASPGRRRERRATSTASWRACLGLDRSGQLGRARDHRPRRSSSSGKTVVEMSAIRAKTRAHDDQSPQPPHRLASSREFSWPMAPGRRTANRSTSARSPAERDATAITRRR